MHFDNMRAIREGQEREGTYFLTQPPPPIYPFHLSIQKLSFIEFNP